MECSNFGAKDLNKNIFEIKYFIYFTYDYDQGGKIKHTIQI